MNKSNENNFLLEENENFLDFSSNAELTTDKNISDIDYYQFFPSTNNNYKINPYFNDKNEDNNEFIYEEPQMEQVEEKKMDLNKHTNYSPTNYINENNGRLTMDEDYKYLHSVPDDISTQLSKLSSTCNSTNPNTLKSNLIGNFQNKTFDVIPANSKFKFDQMFPIFFDNIIKHIIIKRNIINNTFKFNPKEYSIRNISKAKEILQKTWENIIYEKNISIRTYENLADSQKIQYKIPLRDLILQQINGKDFHEIVNEIKILSEEKDSCNLPLNLKKMIEKARINELHYKGENIEKLFQKFFLDYLNEEQTSSN